MRVTKNLAAIDIGTNSFHLVVAEINTGTGRFKILGKDKEIVRLGSGEGDMKYLSDQAMNRGLAALKRFRLTAASYKAEIRAIATSAVREALNKEEFIRRVRLETEIKIEIASGFEEARLIQLGILQALPVFNKKILLIDIGGGSTEFLIGKGRDVFFSNSLKIGAVRLTEKFFPRGNFNDGVVNECRRYIRGSISPIVREISRAGFEECVGSSGTFCTIANIARARRGEPVNLSINNTVFSSKELTAVIKMLLKAKTTRQLAEIPGMEPSRADIIVAGALIVEQIFAELQLSSLTVSDYALREGILVDSIEKLHLPGGVDYLHNIRENSVLHLAETFHYEKQHSQHVAKLAVKLFNSTKHVHGLGTQELEYLEAAAILHDIGFFISHAQHHRHSYYLIRNSELLGFTENEKEIIANVARYHRKSHPKTKHEAFVHLSNDEQQIIKVLASILRVADGLDRSHMSLIEDITVRFEKRRIVLMLNKRDRRKTELEIWSAGRKKLLMEEIFERPIEFHTAN